MGGLVEAGLPKIRPRTGLFSTCFPIGLISDPHPPRPPTSRPAAACSPTTVTLSAPAPGRRRAVVEWRFPQSTRWRRPLPMPVAARPNMTRRVRRLCYLNTRPRGGRLRAALSGTVAGSIDAHHGTALMLASRRPRGASPHPCTGPGAGWSLFWLLDETGAGPRRSQLTSPCPAPATESGWKPSRARAWSRAVARASCWRGSGRAAASPRAR